MEISVFVVVFVLWRRFVGYCFGELFRVFGWVEGVSNLRVVFWVCFDFI